jgi:hypothetical protein
LKKKKHENAVWQGGGGMLTCVLCDVCAVTYA